ncbi:hypothetical protein ACFLS9_01270 [Bacteroidota bacterium]
MADNNKNPLISNEELIYSNMLQLEAVCRVLEKKGIMSQEELLNEVQKVKIEMEEKIKKNTKMN